MTSKDRVASRHCFAFIDFNDLYIYCCQDSPARLRATSENTRTTGNPELPSRPPSCSPWRESSVRNSTSPSRRERSSPALSTSQRHKSRSGFKTAGPRPRDCRRPSWRNWSWQRSRCCRPSPFPSPSTHRWPRRLSTAPWAARGPPFLHRDYSEELMGCTTCLNAHNLKGLRTMPSQRKQLTVQTCAPHQPNRPSNVAKIQDFSVKGGKK